MAGESETGPATGTTAEAAPEQRPLLRVVSPHATPEEVAALVAVFASLGGEEPAPARRTPEWQAHHRKLRAPHAPGPGGWRSSGPPR